MPLRVDVASGATTLSEVDLRLPGYIPLELARCYRSSNERSGPFGVGWTFNYDVTLQQERDRLRYRDASDRECFFRLLDVGTQVMNAETGYVLQHHSNAYIVLQSPQVQQVFLKQNASGGRLRLNRVEDRNGHALQLVYEGQHLIAILDTAGRQVRFTYTSDRLSGMLVVEPGRSAATPVRSFQYDAGGDLVAAVDAVQSEARYAYQNRLMVAYTNRLGGVQYAQYDKKRRCLALWRGDQSQVRLLAYDDLRQSVKVTDTTGAQTVYRHMMGKQVQARIDPLGQTQEYYYDEQEQLFGFTTDSGAVAAFQQQDWRAGMLAQVDGQERVAFFEFNEEGLAEQVLDGNGNAYTLAYDERGNLVQLQTPLESVWRFNRDDRGRVAEVISPTERRVRFGYDKGVRTVEDDFGLHYKAHYDGFGRLIEQTDGLGRHERRTYDPAGRLTTMKIDGCYEVRFAYNAAGYLTGVSDSRQRNFKMQYNTFGRLVARTGPDGRRWQFQYDTEGRLAMIVDSERRTARFIHDAQGRLAQSTSFDGHTATYRYETGGRTIVQREAGETIRDYTPLVALTAEMLPDGTARRFEYGPSGEVLKASLGDRSVLFAYDEEGRLTSVEEDDTYLAFSYDREGKLLKVDPAMGEAMTLRYDRQGRLETIQEGKHITCCFTYDNGSRLDALLLPDRRRLLVQYDLMDRLQERSMEHQGQIVNQHRFRTKDLNVLADPLLRPAEATIPVDPDETVGLDNNWGVLYQSRHGLTLGVRRGRLEVPLWVQDYYFIKDEMSLTRRIVEVVLEGMEASLRHRAMFTGPELLQRWTTEAETGMHVLFTETPSAREVGLPWSALDAFFLRRAFMDASYPHRAPGYLAHHQLAAARSPDPLITGSHMVGYLKPEAWKKRVMRMGVQHTPILQANTQRGLHTTAALFTDAI